MKLSLRYAGEIPSNGTPVEKHVIRLALHKQLAKFWADDSRLKEMNKDLKSLQIAAKSRGSFAVPRPIVGMQNFFFRYPLGGIDFIPLVTNVLECHVHLEIRLYRQKELNGFLFLGGDVDNKFKTFFDALKVPYNEEEVPAQDNVSSNLNEWPVVFCLVDNDRAVTKLNIESIALLSPIPPQTKRPENYVEIEMDVTIVPITPMQGTIDLLFD
jgi:hypothetical protein